MDLFDLSADVAVVIGGTGILGGAIAEGLASAGARVAIVGRNAQRGEARADTMRQAGGQAESAAPYPARPRLTSAHFASR